MSDAFETPLWLCGPLREPKQMLANQEYGGHESLHSDAMAQKLGFQAGPIEGPTHFSQFEPLLYETWGREWFETGCLSSHFRNMVVEGEEVRAMVERPRNGARTARIRAEKADGTEVLMGTASVGTDGEPSEIEARLAGLRPPSQLVILHDVEVGQRGEREKVQMGFDQHLGSLYPFSLNDKLRAITELSPWHTEAQGTASPWGRAIIPLEMVSVLSGYTSRQTRLPVRGPAIGLIADLQIRMLAGPLFVGEAYELQREVVALSESRRTESCWVKSTICRAGESEPIAEVIINQATLKDSYEPYQRELAELQT